MGLVQPGGCWGWDCVPLFGSATDELHRGEGPEEENRRDAEGVQCQPTHRENRIVAWCRGDGW